MEAAATPRLGIAKDSGGSILGFFRFVPTGEGSTMDAMRRAYPDARIGDSTKPVQSMSTEGFDIADVTYLATEKAEADALTAAMTAKYEKSRAATQATRREAKRKERVVKATPKSKRGRKAKTKQAETAESATETTPKATPGKRGRKSLSTEQRVAKAEGKAAGWLEQAEQAKKDGNAKHETFCRRQHKAHQAYAQRIRDGKI